MAEFVAEVRKAVQEERREVIASRAAQESRRKAVSAEIGNVVDAVANDVFHASMKAKMDAHEAGRVEIEARLVEIPEPDPVALHPGISRIYRQKVDSLARWLMQDDTRLTAGKILRILIGAIVARPEEHARDLEPRGELAAILSLCALSPGPLLAGKSGTGGWAGRGAESDGGEQVFGRARQAFLLTQAEEGLPIGELCRRQGSVRRRSIRGGRTMPVCGRRRCGG